ncbi:MAG: hypothetical protein K0S70_93 [Microbacterium sp.]|jgi:hypothetical protein|nr:hypothetical protein [Microbacterium sp.]
MGTAENDSRTTTYTFTKDDLLKLEAAIKLGGKALVQTMDVTDIEGAERSEALYDWMLAMLNDITEQLRGLQ